MLNGSDLINQPWNTTFFPFIRLMGQEWLLVPLLFIAAALFVKTRDTAVVGIFMLGTGAILSAASFSMGTGGLMLFFLFASIGIGVLFYNLFYGGRV